MSEEEILDIKRENYKLRKENFELIQDNVKLNDEINILKIRLKEKICFESNSQFKDLKNELEKNKKIAEKLADKILEMDVDGEVFDFFCKYIPMEKCDEFSDGYCDKCIIDWAKSEVLKNE